jgi:hypothetical protein
MLDVPSTDPGQNSIDVDDAPRLVCRTCEAPITTVADRIGVDGAAPDHVFFNPSGQLMPITTFARATNVTPVSEASGQFTWFVGRTWRIEVCSRCGVQLGWLFEGAAEAPFHGLLQAELVESKPS